MKFEKYLKHLNNIAKDHPEALDFDVITASDDEGNSFNQVHYTPSLGYLGDGSFFPTDTPDGAKPNIVCLN